MKYQIRIENNIPIIGYNVEKIMDENEYSIDITIGLETVDGLIQFSKTITVISDNSMTGFQVDAQRDQAIDDYLDLINS